MCGGNSGYGDMQAAGFLDCPCACAFRLVNVLNYLVFHFVEDIGVALRILCSANVGADGDKKVFDLRVDMSKGSSSQ